MIDTHCVHSVGNPSKQVEITEGTSATTFSLTWKTQIPKKTKANEEDLLQANLT